jgi:hypothetical protein
VEKAKRSAALSPMARVPTLLISRNRFENIALFEAKLNFSTAYIYN